MELLLVLFSVGVVCDLLFFVVGAWSGRKVFAALAWVATLAASALAVTTHMGLWGLCFGVLGLYRILNDARLVESRMQEFYLKRATFRTAAVLILLQAVSFVLLWVWDVDEMTLSQHFWTVLTGLQAVAAGTVLLTVFRRLGRTRWPHKVAALVDAKMPTITVAIPARNETEDLEACLTSVLASSYPKLEVLVLDDCSQNKHTPEIIRSFAQGGVRFIQGEEPSQTWLPKNQAYDRLAQQASGDYILFCGVDVRFDTNSIRELYATLVAKDKRMLCVLPWRAERAKGFALTQAMRYWWELAPPRRLFRRPPVLSTCWMIERAALKKAGGFAACRHAIVPEAYLARQLIQTDDGYTLLRANQTVGIVSAKGAKEQQATAVRTRYPQLHRRPENVALLSVFEALTLVLPYVLALAGFWLPIGQVAQLLAALAAVLLTVSYELLSTQTRTGNWWFGLVGLPVGTLYDMGLLHYSMWKYEFSTVDWKGRNVCIPAMHVVPHLPKL